MADYIRESDLGLKIHSRKKDVLKKHNAEKEATIDTWGEGGRQQENCY